MGKRLVPIHDTSEVLEARHLRRGDIIAYSSALVLNRNPKERITPLEGEILDIVKEVSTIAIKTSSGWLQGVSVIRKFEVVKKSDDPNRDKQIRFHNQNQHDIYYRGRPYSID